MYHYRLRRSLPWQKALNKTTTSYGASWDECTPLVEPFKISWAKRFVNLLSYISLPNNTVLSYTVTSLRLSSFRIDSMFVWIEVLMLRVVLTFWGRTQRSTTVEVEASEDGEWKDSEETDAPSSDIFFDAL